MKTLLRKTGSTWMGNTAHVHITGFCVANTEVFPVWPTYSTHSYQNHNLYLFIFYLMYKSVFASLYSYVHKFAWSAQEGQRRATDPLELELQAGFRVYKL